MGSDAATCTSLLANTSAAFKWKLRAHWLNPGDRDIQFEWERLQFCASKHPLKSKQNDLVDSILSITYPYILAVFWVYKLRCNISTAEAALGLWDVLVRLPVPLRWVSVGSRWRGMGDTGGGHNAGWFTWNMMTSSNGNIFRVTGPLCGEFTGHRWIPHTKASDEELWCFLWSAPE